MSAYDRYYPFILDSIKAIAFDVIDYYSVNRSRFSGLTFTQSFTKLYDECRQILDIPDDDLAQAVDVCLTLEQRRVNSYSNGNLHIEDYTPANMKDWREYK